MVPVVTVAPRVPVMESRRAWHSTGRLRLRHGMGRFPPGNGLIAPDRPREVAGSGLGTSAATAPSFTQPVTAIGLTFNTPVTGLTLNDIRLFYENRSVSLAGAVLTGSGTTWKLTIPRTSTSLKGNYRLDVGGPGSSVSGSGALMTTVSSLFWRRV